MSPEEMRPLILQRIEFFKESLKISQQNTDRLKQYLSFEEDRLKAIEEDKLKVQP
jgi:hypothetical protein